MYKEMNVSVINTGFKQQVTWEAKDIIRTPGPGTWILLPEIQRGTATVSFQDGATGTVECTSDSIVDIRDDNATAQEWVNGEVSETTQDTFKKCSAIRGKMISPGIMTITVVAK